MAIIVNLDMMLAKRKMTSLELANRVGMTPANLSILKTCLLYTSDAADEL